MLILISKIEILVYLIQTLSNIFMIFKTFSSFHGIRLLCLSVRLQAYTNATARSSWVSIVWRRYTFFRIEL